MVEEIKECGMRECKNVSLELGRFISEMSLKAISQPHPSIDSEKDIETLDKLLAYFRNSCSIKEVDMGIINRNFVELRNISPTATGTRLVQPLADLMSNIDNARSDCDCKKIK